MAKGLFDNDILVKLCAFNLHEDVLIEFHIDRVIVLDSLYFKRNHIDWLEGKRCQKRPDWARRLSATLQQAQPLGTVDPELLVRMENLGPGVDPGEALLLTAAITEEDVLFFTGDKRFLKSLTTNINKLPNQKLLNGKLLFLEFIILHFLNIYGLDWLKNKIVPERECDTYLRAVFGSGMTSTENNVRDGLEREVKQLRSILGDLLYPLPYSF